LSLENYIDVRRGDGAGPQVTILLRITIASVSCAFSFAPFVVEFVELPQYQTARRLTRGKTA
jgi:hypothetical protein